MVLGGELKELEPLRHTPAGVPLMNFSILHRSTQVEAGIDRRVECEVQALALGDAALKLGGQAPGTAVRVRGFVANRGRAGRALIVHVNNVEFF